jgi:hypothetical protein
LIAVAHDVSSAPLAVAIEFWIAWRPYKQKSIGTLFQTEKNAGGSALGHHSPRPSQPLTIPIAVLYQLFTVPSRDPPA